MYSITTSAGTKNFDTKRQFMIHEAVECIKLDMPYGMYVSYMEQWDESGESGFIFDGSSYALIKVRVNNNLPVA